MPERIPEFVINALGLFDPEKYSPSMVLDTLSRVISPGPIWAGIITAGLAWSMLWIDSKHTSVGEQELFGEIDSEDRRN